MLRVVLLVACVVIAFGCLVYFFVWNRIFGSLLGAIVRLVIWTQDGSAVWVDFGSAHLSLISGRILLRDVRYHSSNQTFRVVKCQLSWRWWIRRVAEEENLADSHSDGVESTSDRKHHPRCRIHASMEGFEWFMYNRTASFDNIVSQLSASSPVTAGIRTRSRESDSHSINRSVLVRDEARSRTSIYAAGRRALSAIRFPSFIDKLSSAVTRQLPDLDPNNLLPLSFDIVKGAITMGNHTTENLLMAQFAQASGTYGIIQSRSRLDDHRQLLRIAFKEATISCVENPDYWTSNHNVGKTVHECVAQSDPVFNLRTIPLAYNGFKKLWIRCRKHFPFFKARGRLYVKPDREHKRKGKRAREETSHVGADFTALEYAKDRKLLEALLLELVYYADVAGLVPDKPTVNPDHDVRSGVCSGAQNGKNIELMDIGNADLPPEWGIDVVVHGGAIHYGPWADRQRAQLQRVFFPQTFQTAEPTSMLLPGDQRSFTCLKLFFEFQGVTTVHLPFREASKNWQWDGLADVPRMRRQREAASIQLRLGDKSSVKYLVPMVATTEGYTAELDVLMDNISVTSSLNDIRLLEADSCSVSSFLPSPLQWNSERNWDFNVSLDRPILYIIRDHIHMLTDLGKDWSSGPPSNFNTFVPITYSLYLNFHEFELNLYANDHNIIDRPLDRRDNVLFTLKGDMLKNITSIPSNKFRPLSSTVSFSIAAPDVALSLTLPRWNTHGLSAPSIKCLTNIGQVGLFQLKGTYRYHAEVRNDCVDQLKLDIKVLSPSLKLFGWIIRHVMVLRENYFGGFTQYSTTREYLSKRANGTAVGDPLDLKYRPGKSNIFHLDLSFLVSNAIIALPAGVVGFERVRHGSSEGADIGSCTVLAIPELQLQLRLHDYFMDMSLNVDPVVVSIVDSCPDELLLAHMFVPSKRQISISGIHITANRLFGPQPRTSTYVCIWNICLGNVRGAVSTVEAQTLVATGKSFGQGYSDPFNAPASDFAIAAERDATFLKVVVDGLDITWKNAPAAVRFCLTEGLRLGFNNIAEARHRKLTSVIVPVLDVQILLVPSTAKHWLEAGRIRTGVSIDLYSAPKGWRKDANEQKSFLETQDVQTHRFASMIGPGGRYNSSRWSNSLYIQRIYAPRLSPAPGKKQGPQLVPLPIGARRTIRRSFIESESDDDRLISEANRDERLANSRPASSAFAFVQREDGHSTSPFDESDETDSEDSENSWSDYFEFGADRNGADPRVPYWTFCRKLQLRRASAELNYQSEFVVRRETPSLQAHLFSEDSWSTHAAINSKATFNASQPERDTTDTESRTYTCVDIKNIGVFLTPLCAMSLREILEQHDFEQRSPELQLDEIMLKRIAADTETSASVYDVRLRSVKLCVVHEIADLLKVQLPTKPLNKDYHAFAITNIGAEGIQCLLGFPSPNKSALSDSPSSYGRFSVRKVTGSMASLYASAVPTKRATGALSVAIEYSLNDLTIALVKSRLQVSQDTSELRVFRTAPEVVLAAAGALQVPLKELSAAQKSRASLTRLRKKQLVCSILVHSSNAASKDLLSSVQPAFFVQSGRPHQLRGDSNWKLLFHLRHSLSGASREEYETLKQELSRTPMVAEMDALLQNRQVPWVLEEGLPLVKVELIESLLKGRTKEDHPVKRNDNTPIRSIGFHASALCLALDGGESLSQSSLIIRGIDLRADLLTRRLIFEAHSLSPYSSTIRSFRPTSDYVDYGSMSAMLALNIDSVQVTIFPGIIELLQNAIHVWRIMSPSSEPRVGDENKMSLSPSSFLNEFLDNRVVACDVRVIFQHMLIEAAAENIVFQVSSRQISACYVGHITKPLGGPPPDLALNHMMNFRDFSVKARTRSFVDRGMDTLACITVLGGLCCLLFQNHTPEGSTLRSTLHATSVELNVPRSAIRLYKFIEQWRQDYLLGVDAMIKSLFTEIRQSPDRPVQASAKKSGFGVNINAYLATASVTLQVMHGTWLTWTTHGIIGYLTDKPEAKGMIRACGLQIASQTIRITSMTSRPGDWSSGNAPGIVLDLPSISASGSFSVEHIGLLISVGFLKVTVKPSHWDSLLSVQQKFGQDFNDLLLILGDAKSKGPATSSQKSSVTRVTREVPPFYVTARFEGFRIGLEGLSSTQFLECVDIDAMISNKVSPQWRVTLTDLALYLSPRSLAKQKHAELDRNQLPVLVSVDLQVVSHRSSSQDQHRRLEMDITKVHAILQAHLVGDIGGFIDHLQTELTLRKEQRAAELNDFKEKARKVMQTFNMNPRKSSMVKQETFWDISSVAISMANLGAAFPLDLERRKAPKFGLDKEITTKAFLLSIESFNFETQRGESGEALMKGFCFQFVSGFNSSNPEDFSAGRHHTLNQMLYPEMRARVHTETTSSARHIFASASISGFILDLDPSITSYAFSLVDAYRHGKQSVEQLVVGLPRSVADAGSTAPRPELNKEGGRRNTVILSVEASLKFMSGTVRMHCTSKDSAAFQSISPDWPSKTYQILDSDAELFQLPELSVSAEYRADVRQFNPSSRHALRSPVLVFRSTVHSSRNALRPPVLSFLSGVVHNFEERMKRVSHTITRPPSSIRHPLSTPTMEEPDASAFKFEEPASSSFQLFISLRIDKSRLEFTCKPDVNVVAGVNWESGGFIFNLGPGAKGVSISASIEGLTIGLKHGFLSEDSAHIDARNLIFSVNFSKSGLSTGHFVNSISVIVDTEFSGGIRFSRFQDFLCFKAVWLDHIPVFKGDTVEDISSPSRLSVVSSLEQTPKQGFDTAVIIRVRHISLEADLGQSISTITFDLQTALIRTRLTSKYSELSISFAHVAMQSRGNLSGHLRMPDFAFRTVRRRHTIELEQQPLSRMLELNLTSGTLDIQLQSDWLWLLQYRAEPLEATIYDDWTVDSPTNAGKDRQLHLYFSVSGSKVIAMMTIMAIPKLLMYAGKLRSSLEAQREGASRESSAFRSTRLPKPDNALSEVANAMFQSARTKLKGTELLSYVINQHMKLQLNELVFVVLPRSQGDNELARFIGRNVMAQLHRTMQQIGLPAHRDLQLSLSHMSISQLLKQGFDPRLPGQEFDVLTTGDRSFSGTENVIFSLPAMDMRMITDETTEEGLRVLLYDFVSNFARREGQKGENINISFNIRLYSWLTILRKTFTRELKRAQEVADWRTANVSPPNLTAPRLASPDTFSSPFAFGTDETYSPPGSRPSSRHSSRPSSPVRSRSTESVIVPAASKAQNSQYPVLLTSPKFGLSETTKAAEQNTASSSTQSPPTSGEAAEKSLAQDSPAKKPREILYRVRSRKIERLTVKQLGEATPDVMHPFFTRKAGFNLEESLPQYVHEYATLPIEEIMTALVKLYSKQLN